MSKYGYYGGYQRPLRSEELQKQEANMQKELLIAERLREIREKESKRSGFTALKMVKKRNTFFQRHDRIIRGLFVSVCLFMVYWPLTSAIYRSSRMQETEDEKLIKERWNQRYAKYGFFLRWD